MYTCIYVSAHNDRKNVKLSRKMTSSLSVSMCIGSTTHFCLVSFQRDFYCFSVTLTDIGSDMVLNNHDDPPPSCRPPQEVSRIYLNLL